MPYIIGGLVVWLAVGVAVIWNAMVDPRPVKRGINGENYKVRIP